MRIVYTEQARDDLAEVVEFLRTRNPIAALKVAGAIRAWIANLARHPRLGRAQSDGSGKLVVMPYPYPVLYDIDDRRDRVSILAIRHPARLRSSTDV